MLSRPSDLTLSPNLLHPLPVQTGRQRSQRDTHSLHLPESTLFTFLLPPRLGRPPSKAPCLLARLLHGFRFAHSSLNHHVASSVTFVDTPLVCPLRFMRCANWGLVGCVHFRVRESLCGWIGEDHLIWSCCFP